MQPLRGYDTISGQEGMATANINGEIHPMFEIRELEATITKNKQEVRTIGRRGAQQKSTGYSGEGSMTIFYVTSRYREIMLDYVKNGVDTFFDVTVVNDDPTSTIGKQTVVLKGVNLDEAVIAKLAADDDVLDEDVSFTFDDFDILDSFNDPVV